MIIETYQLRFRVLFVPFIKDLLILSTSFLPSIGIFVQLDFFAFPVYTEEAMKSVIKVNTTRKN